MYGVYSVILAGKSSNVRSYTVYTYGSGQPYIYVYSVYLVILAWHKEIIKCTAIHGIYVQLWPTLHICIRCVFGNFGLA